MVSRAQALHTWAALVCDSRFLCTGTAARRGGDRSATTACPSRAQAWLKRRS
jgi:hypothetical protein